MRTGRTGRAYAAIFALAVASLLATGAGRCGRHVQRSQEEVDLDNMMAAKVRENLTAVGPQLRATEIAVSVVQLAVTLEGQVRSAAERDLAVQVAREAEVVRAGTTFRVKTVEAKNLAIKPQ
jgi:osmotically-inducible protein OsmY